MKARSTLLGSSCGDFAVLRQGFDVRQIFLFGSLANEGEHLVLDVDRQDFALLPDEGADHFGNPPAARADVRHDHARLEVQGFRRAW
jgi:hypothetical protein